ncbi:MAG: biotin-dependent carboxyltransferase family protein [Hyphomicrobiaceae bacterium]
MKPALRVVAPGLMTTLQDLGRSGYQHLGIPVSGALDAVALRAANAIVGNPPGMGALEIAYQGPALAVEAASARVAYAGGIAAIEVLDDAAAASGTRLAPLQSVRLGKEQVLRIGALSGSVMGYLAVEGGFDAAPMLGSQSTYARAGLGGFDGRALRAGDSLPLRRPEAEEREERRLPSLDLTTPGRVRVVLGPQDDYFSDRGKRTLLESTFTVSSASDRMGMRLDGPTLEHSGSYNIVSDGIAPGSIQVPGNGLPIVLLADRQTTGGYPKIATVIAADLAALGRLAPGAKVAFEAVSIETAEAAHRRLAALLAALPRQVVAVRAASTIDEAALLAANLVSGVVSAHDPQWEPP